jgi:cysteine synthase A
MVMSSTIEAIGNTPLVELSRITKSLPGRILAKLDYLNPGFSKKGWLRTGGSARPSSA